MPFTIAELGSNIRPFTKSRINMFIDSAALAGADAVKIQLFKADHFPNEERAAKQALEFPRELFGWFLERAEFYKLQGGASVFDKDAIDLCTRLGANFIKLATREQFNSALRQYANRRFKGTIFRSINFERVVTYEPRMPREVTLGCIPRYPTAVTNKLLDLIEERLSFGWLRAPFGWSSHTIGFDDLVVAVTWGAKVIEKHLKVSDNDLEAKWSIDPFEWMTMERILDVC